MECARSFLRVAGRNQVEYRARTSLGCLRWGNLTKEWHGKLPGKKTGSHLITGPFPSVFLLFVPGFGTRNTTRVVEGGNYATAVPG